jgi:hypothetical protein
MYKRIMIEPQSFDKELRLKASAEGDRLGVGVRMELHSAHTEYWADPTIPVGKMDVWCGKYYKAPLEYVVTISPDEDWTLDEWLAIVRGE